MYPLYTIVAEAFNSLSGQLLAYLPGAPKPFVNYTKTVTCTQMKQYNQSLTCPVPKDSKYYIFMSNFMGNTALKIYFNIGITRKMAFKLGIH